MPTIQINVTAIKLKADVLAEKGDYLLIYPDERVVVVHQSEATSMVDLIKSANAPEPEPTAPKKFKRRYLLGPDHQVKFRINGHDGVLPKSRFRVLQKMGRWTQPQFVGVLNSSGQASKLRLRGLVTHDQETHLWHITDQGRAVIQAVYDNEENTVERPGPSKAL